MVGWDSHLPRNAIPLPQPEPRVVRAPLVVSLVRSVAVGQLERPCVRKRVDAIQPLYLGDGLLDIHGAFEGMADSNSAISAASTTSSVAISSVSLRIACECENKIRSSRSCCLSNAIRCSTE